MVEDVTIVQFHEFGSAEVLRTERIACPTPGPGEVRMRIKSIGVNRADIMCREGSYVMDTGTFPAKIGFEASGIVEAVGDEVSSDWIGKRV